jgi:hypothetical protein
MLVKYMVGPGVSCGSEQVRPTTMHAPRADGRSWTTFHTTFSRQLVTGAPIVAALAVVPLAADDDPEAVAAGISFEPVAGGGLNAILPAAGGPVTIRVGDGPVVFRRGRSGGNAR